MWLDQSLDIILDITIINLTELFLNSIVPVLYF